METLKNIKANTYPQVIQGMACPVHSDGKCVKIFVQ